jgi:hypothetical protein
MLMLPAIADDTTTVEGDGLAAVAEVGQLTTSLSAKSYPQALPNDGLSMAEISVVYTQDGEPVVDKMVHGELETGDGILVYADVRTDEEGLAIFQYNVGIAPVKSEISFTVEGSDAECNAVIPLAPVSYIDVLLVTPEEYQAYLDRQVAAAPIYELELSAFPDQLAADGGSLSTIDAQLNHIDGKPAAGVVLVPDIISGEGELVTDKLATDSNGALRFYYIAGTTVGTVTIRVMEPSTGLVSTVDILLVEAGPARIELYYEDPFNHGHERENAILPADGTTPLPMIARVTDLLDIPLAGVEVRLEVLDVPNGWIEVFDPVTNMDGIVNFNYYAGTTTGQIRIRAYLCSGLDYSEL